MKGWAAFMLFVISAAAGNYGTAVLVLVMYIVWGICD
jgi:hypothetical protein